MLYAISYEHLHSLDQTKGLAGDFYKIFMLSRITSKERSRSGEKLTVISHTGFLKFISHFIGKTSAH